MATSAGWLGALLYNVIAATRPQWRTILIILMLSTLIGMLIMYVDPYIGQD